MMLRDTARQNLEMVPNLVLATKAHGLLKTTVHEAIIPTHILGASFTKRITSKDYLLFL